MKIESGKLRSFGEIEKILGKEGFRESGFDIPVGSKVTARRVVVLNRVDEELPSISDVAMADDMELQEIMENVARSTENLTAQLKGESFEDLPMRELLGLDKQLRSIRHSLRVEVAKKVQLEERIKGKKVQA